jgi:aspartate kinase
MKVLKFGGTSVGSAGMMKNVAKLINNGKGTRIIVLSAMAGTTNRLLEIAEKLYRNKKEIASGLIKNLEGQYYRVVDELFSLQKFKDHGKDLVKSHFNFINNFTRDLFTIHEEKAVLAQGELLSSSLFHFYLNEQKINSVLLPALNFMRIDTNGEPDNYYIRENLKREMQLHPGQKLFITQGYICRNLYGEIDNLKRGGSDYSASLIGAASHADEIQIWTDVSGFHFNDPRFVKGTKPISRLSFDEAAELAYFGAKILHPASILPAKNAKIPVRLKNTLKPSDPGTLITDKADGKGIKAIAAKDGIVAIKIISDRMLLAYGFLRKVFEVFERYKTPIDMITTAEVAVSVTIDDKANLEKILDELKTYGVVEVNENMTIICLVGYNIIEQKGFKKEIFSALKKVSIRMISFGGSNHNISILISNEDKRKALKSLNKIFK